MYTTEKLVLEKSRLENERFEDGFDITSFIKEAQSRIDVKLRKRYKVPLVEPIPGIIESIATNFAAGFVIERDYSNRPEKNEPYLAEVLIRRAEDDLADVIELKLLDGMPGIEYAEVPGKAFGSCTLRSTTPIPSEMDMALAKW